VDRGIDVKHDTDYNVQSVPEPETRHVLAKSLRFVLLSEILPRLASLRGTPDSPRLGIS
jgi:hypothetical protein